MSTATKTHTEGSQDANEQVSWDLRDLQADAEQFAASSDAKNVSFELAEARFVSKYEQYKSRPDKVKRILKEAIHQVNIQLLKELQAESKSKVNKLASFAVFNEGDRRDFLYGQDVDTSNLKVVLDTIKFLKTSVAKYLPQAEAELRQKDAYFWGTLGRLEKNGIISSASAKRWERRYLDTSTQWYIKSGFLEKDFPKYVATWEAIHAHKEEVLSNITKAGFKANDHKHFARLTSKQYLEADYRRRHSDVETAEATLDALKRGNTEQLRKTESLLDAAISKKVLAKHKKGRWLKEVFNDSTTYNQRAQFLQTRLPQIIASWTQAKQTFTTLSTQAKQKELGTFTVVDGDTFIAWHYDARVAYNKELAARLQEPVPAKFDFATIQKELDKGDFASALHYITLVQLGNLTTEEKSRLQTMKQFAQTQLQELKDSEIGTVIEGNEQSELEEALHFAHQISPALHALYIAALKHGYGMLTTVSTIAYNGLSLKQRQKNATLKASEQQEAEVEQQEVELRRHGINGQILQSLMTEDAEELEAMKISTTNKVAPQKTAEPVQLDVMRISSSGSGVGSIISRCASEQNNGAFLQESMLIIDGIPSTVMRYALQHVHPKITAGARAHYTSPR